VADLVLADGKRIRPAFCHWGFALVSADTYSTPTASGLNYIRNAVKVVIDAYDGTVDYYIADPDDPIIQAYDSAFPGLFHDLEEFPEDLIAHIRYPQDLFDIQAQQYLAYHMTDTRVFYNKEDLWAIPLEIFDGTEQVMEPYYVYLRLLEEEDPEYLLIQPFTPSGKQNMIAWMAARNDPGHYGELVVYELPKQELVFGPLQVEGRIDQEPEISQQFSLWDQRGSRVIRGNLLVIPINDSFVYVEPIYLLSDTSALPELKRVIVVYGKRVVMEPTLAGALRAVFAAPPSPVGAATGGVPPGGTPATQGPALGAARRLFDRAEDALRRGDWVQFGQAMEKLGDYLRKHGEGGKGP